MGKGTFQERALNSTELQSNVPKLEGTFSHSLHLSQAPEQQQRGPRKEDPAENRAFAYTQRDDFKEFPPSMTTHPISPSIREEI